MQKTSKLTFYLESEKKTEQTTSIKSHVQMDKYGPKRPFVRESHVQIDTTFTHEI